MGDASYMGAVYMRERACLLCDQAH
jgi:hypothetical protein